MKNIFTQAMKPARFSVMLKKLLKRLSDKRGNHTKEENLQWLEFNSSDFKELALSIDADLWHETELVSESIEKRAAIVLDGIEDNLGGGGAYPFLYFVTRYMLPVCVVETGVAAGFSSFAFLLALRENQKGTLYSSDFPYFRIPQPERYIGILVEESLKMGWKLYLDGDESNLPKIVNEVDEVDIFHYDSDKSYSGRENAISIISSSLSNRGVILMDDVQDNTFFYDYVEETNPGYWYIFRYKEKYLGMIGRLTR